GRRPARSPPAAGPATARPARAIRVDSWSWQSPALHRRMRCRKPPPARWADLAGPKSLPLSSRGYATSGMAPGEAGKRRTDATGSVRAPPEHAMNLEAVEIKAFVPARDMDLSLRFYRDLGFSVPWSSDELAYLHAGDCSFLLQKFYVAEHAGNFM